MSEQRAAEAPESWVRVERHGGSGEVAELVLARVGAMNAISTEMARQLAAATVVIQRDPVIDISSIGRHH